MNFTGYLEEQLRLHPAMQYQDLIKMSYQAARGAEHLLSDMEAARRYFESEYAAVEAEDGILYEAISDDICRVNLKAWKAKGLPGEWLFRMFAASSSIPYGGEELLLAYLEQVQKQIPDSLEFISQYKKSGMPAVHHSDIYREMEHPAYRIIQRRFLRTLPVLELAAKQGSGIIAIDGRAASGKSTMAQLLARILDAPVVQMDDFFVPPALRSEERFKVPGSNVHYERFEKEVLPYIKSRKAFRYRIFDCSMMDYHGEKEIPVSEWRIVEGSYSQHPRFGKYADIAVYSDVEPAEQMERIKIRNGERMAEMFRTRWIPMEEAYFNAYDIRVKADLVV